jgi:hypothetical protein
MGDYYYPIFGCFVIFCLWLCYELRKNTKQMDKETSDFWERESAANLTRRVNPDTLPYIEIPLENFPIGKFDDQTLTVCEQKLRDLSGKKILNLTGKTTTELKSLYGPANLPLLDECDINYTELVKTVADYGVRLSELGHDHEAIAVLEFGIAILTDISSNYKCLAMLYLKAGDLEKISSLQAAAGKLDSLMKPSILKMLEEISISQTVK